MRKVCHSCGARFVIADRLVRGKIVRFRCRHCATVLEVYLPAHAEGVEPHRREGRPHLPPPLPPREVFIVVEGRQIGPMSIAEFRLLVSSGQVGPEDLVWHRGLATWQPLLAVDELQTALGETVQRQRLHPPPLPQARVPVSARDASRYLHSAPPPQTGTPGGSLEAGAALTSHYPVETGAGFAGTSPVWQVLAPPAQRQIQWPLWVLTVGMLAILAAAISVLLILVWPPGAGSGREEIPLSERYARRVQADRRLLEEVAAVPRSAAQVPDEKLEEVRSFPPLEVHSPRPRGTREAGPDAAIAPQTDSAPSSTPLAQKLGVKSDDVRTSLAARIYRQNRRSLLACDQLAERRGETLTQGSWALFEVRVSADGEAEVKLQGHLLSEEILRCYRSVSSEWKYPLQDMEYSTAFKHMH